MGHLLSTVNPAAANALENRVAPPRPPYLGESVLYRTRPGEMGNQGEIAATVTRLRDADRVDLVLFPPSHEQHHRENVGYGDDATQYNSWFFAPEAIATSQTDLAALCTEQGKVIDTLVEQITNLEERLDAQTETTKVAKAAHDVLDTAVDNDKRRVNARLDALDKRIDRVPGVRKPGRPGGKDDDAGEGEGS